MDNQITEETFENQPINVELESLKEERRLIKPWDPDLIRITPRTFSLAQILEMIAEKDIELAPDFQRLQVWKPLQKSLLVESILLGIPMPAFYFSQDKDGKLQVVDGLQRLSTINEFAGEQSFALSGLEYLRELDGLKFAKLAPVFLRRFRQTQIQVQVIDPQTPYQVKFDVFRRINTGGSPLNGQEIRHCLSSPRVRDFLKRCVESEAFKVATGGALENHVRMADREVVLRFCAFKLLESQYAESESFDKFLGRADQELNDLSDSSLAELEVSFLNAMTNACVLFGDLAFRKIHESGRKTPLNKAIFDAWSVALSDCVLDDLVEQLSEFQAIARAVIMEPKFVESVSQSTDTISKVRYRLEAARQAVQSARR